MLALVVGFGLLGHTRAVSADPAPLLAGVSTAQATRTAPPTRVPVVVARDPLLITPRRTPERRVFDVLRVEPWMRGGRIGVRMSASF